MAATAILPVEVAAFAILPVEVAALAILPVEVAALGTTHRVAFQSRIHDCFMTNFYRIDREYPTRYCLLCNSVLIKKIYMPFM